MSRRRLVDERLVATRFRRLAFRFAIAEFPPMDAANGEGVNGKSNTLAAPVIHGYRGLATDLAALLAMVFVAFLIGCLVNTFRAEPLPWRYQSREEIIGAGVTLLQDAPASLSATGGSVEPTHEIRLEEFQPFVTEHRGVVLDARPRVFYQEAHIPRALSLPRETFAEDYPGLRERLEREKDHQIAVYCSGPDCPDSQLVAEALSKLGYQRLVIYTSGWEEWSSTGLPQEGISAAP